MGDAGAVDRRIAELYGEVDLARRGGVVHVTSVWEDEGALRAIAITATTPRSPTDFFALNLARARADAIVVTGRVLRAEPELRYDLQGMMAGDLHAWRRDRANRPDPPRVIVLTSGRGLDLAHPAFNSWATPVVFTTQEAAARLGDADVQVVADDEPSARNAIDWALGRGASTVTLEAGPSTTSELYVGRLAVDEVMLSEFCGELEQQHRGASFLEREVLEEQFVLADLPSVREEPSGPWRFSRWTRARAVSR